MIGTTLGPYQILDRLGAGGMGTVYRARDTSLKRDVAIKVLPESLAGDRERLQRFQREAESLAALNHPNIAHIYGLVRADDGTPVSQDVVGTPAIVMELVSGQTLAERIAGRALPIDESLDIARQITDALEAAHARGIIHRDLKPANVKVTGDGVVKVLDFGLAKMLDSEPTTGVPEAIANSPTATARGTRAGVVLGTAPYMAPEQARGLAVDRRVDIWAFGAVLYEMLTGRRAFDGADVVEIMARVIDRDPDWTLLPDETPAAVRRLLRRCLSKPRSSRLRDIGDARLEIDDAPGEEDVPDGVPGKPTASPPRWWLVATLLTAVVVAVLVWARPPARVAGRPSARYTEALPTGAFFQNEPHSVLALAPDGSAFVFNTGDGLWFRAMDQLEARVIPGTDTDAERSTPFFSPDGQRVGFWRSGQLVWVGVGGGTLMPITPATQPGGARWLADDTILFGQPDGIHQVAASGGRSELLIPASAGTLLHGPFPLPDGDSIMYSVTDGMWSRSRVVVRSLATGQEREIVPRGRDAQYLLTGHLVYWLDSVLYAVVFDVDRLSTIGEPVPLVYGLQRQDVSGAANYAVADDGTLLYASFVSRPTRVVWVDRQGREEALPLRSSYYWYPRLSPDDRRVVLDDRNATLDLIVWDFAAQTDTRLALGDRGGGYPVWTPDGERIAYTAAGDSDIHWIAANNSTAPEVLFTAPGRPGSFSPSPYEFTSDGLLFREWNHPQTGDNVGFIPLTGSAGPTWLLDEEHFERNTVLSPDGRFLAYQATYGLGVTDRSEIIVRPFPRVGEDSMIISTARGYYPAWSRDGRELFYIQFDASGPRMISVAVDTSGDRLRVGARTPLFDWSPYLAGPQGRTYDVAADGRFVAIKLLGTDEIPPARPNLVIIRNWFDDVKRALPTDSGWPGRLFR